MQQDRASPLRVSGDAELLLDARERCRMFGGATATSLWAMQLMNQHAAVHIERDSGAVA
jgi:hypothetical protein